MEVNHPVLNLIPITSEQNPKLKSKASPKSSKIHPKKTPESQGNEQKS